MSEIGNVSKKMENSLQNLHKILIESTTHLTEENIALRKEVIRQEEIITALSRIIYTQMENKQREDGNSKN